MQTKFTTGPWQAETEYDCLDLGFAVIAVDKIRPEIVTPTRGMVAFVHAILPEDINKGRANAHLIAAAPDLLEALESLLHTAAHFNAWDSESEVALMARAAIRKARGE